MKIILITGKARSGKDTAAEFIRETLEENGRSVLVTHYADLVKYVCTKFFGWNGLKDDTGRTLLQKVGTDCVRRENPDFWVDFILFMLECFPDEWDYVIIPDCRFRNEYEKPVREKFDTTLLRIVRPGYDGGLSESQKSHPSETEQDELFPDQTIVNDGSVDEYKGKLQNWVKETFHED